MLEYFRGHLRSSKGHYEVTSSLFQSDLLNRNLIWSLSRFEFVKNTKNVIQSHLRGQYDVQNAHIDHGQH